MRGGKGELKTLRAESHLPLSPSCRLMESVENSRKQQFRTKDSKNVKHSGARRAGESLPPLPQPAIHSLFLSGFLSCLESKRKEAKENRDVPRGQRRSRIASREGGNHTAARGENTAQACPIRPLYYQYSFSTYFLQKISERFRTFSHLILYTIFHLESRPFSEFSDNLPEAIFSMRYFFTHSEDIMHENPLSGGLCR